MRAFYIFSICILQFVELIQRKRKDNAFYILKNYEIKFFLNIFYQK